MTASIVIPVFNRAHLVHRAIDTALAQDVPCEVVVVDHGSRDAIAEVMRRYEGRVRYVRREQDRGPVAAWRDGIEQATGEYVHITYDDDWLEPSFMSRCLALMGPDVGFAYSRVTLHFPRRTEPSVLHPAGVRPMEEFVQYLLRDALTLSPGCAVFRRRDALECLPEQVEGATGRFGPGKGVGEDLLLFLLTSLRYPRYAHVDAPLANFLAHDESITINAIRGGRRRELAEAYGRARAQYLRMPGALSPDGAVQAQLRRVRWWLDSKALPLYALKAWRRLRA